MKNLFYAFTLIAVVLFTGCGDDDEAPSPGLSGSVTFDGTATNISTGLLADFGLLGNSYNVDFYVSDGEIDFINDGTSGSILVYIELFNDGDAFSPGTFEYGNNSAERSIGDAFVQTAGNVSRPTGGSVTVTGSGSTFEITYNLEFTDNITLTGTVNGTFASQSLTLQ